MNETLLVLAMIWYMGAMIFTISILWYYKRQPTDRLPVWGTILIIIFWFVSFPVALIILLIIWIDIQYFSDEGDK
ncbi:MAG TPA: hypothetical protein DD649_12775 [Providencia sp.]|uniref:hypothetical protein n=1 Tax=Providencia sp. TaxID=589 RepID=UPI000E7F92C9|nr:hypothetical protein [Providencia sp.]HBO23743.1 hypothetical protein [Providencia sp.]